MRCCEDIGLENRACVRSRTSGARLRWQAHREGGIHRGLKTPLEKAGDMMLGFFNYGRRRSSYRSLAALGAIIALSATSVDALGETVNFTFDGATTPVGYTDGSNAYSAILGPFTLTAAAGLGSGSYLSRLDSDGPNVTHSSGGLGVTRYGGSPTDPNNTLERQINGSEVLWLTFNPTAVFDNTVFVLDGANENAVFYTAGGDSILPSTSVDISLPLQKTSYSFSGVSGNVIGIGYTRNVNDGIKLDSIQVSSPVPLPGAAAGGIALLASVGGARAVRSKLDRR
jgi:hypothetical protein